MQLCISRFAASGKSSLIEQCLTKINQASPRVDYQQVMATDEPAKRNGLTPLQFHRTRVSDGRFRVIGSNERRLWREYSHRQVMADATHPASGRIAAARPGLSTERFDQALIRRTRLAWACTGSSGEPRCGDNGFRGNSLAVNAGATDGALRQRTGPPQGPEGFDSRLRPPPSGKAASNT